MKVLHRSDYLSHSDKKDSHMMLLSKSRPIFYTPPLNKPKRKRNNKNPVYSHPKQASKTVRILDLIEQRGGMTYSQIVKQLYKWSHPDSDYSHSNRGFWASNLCSIRRHKGILDTFCTKVGKLWVRNSTPHHDRPWAIIKPTKTWNVASPLISQRLALYSMQSVYVPYIPLIVSAVP